MNKKIYHLLTLFLNAAMKFTLCYSIIVLPVVIVKISESFIFKAFLLFPLCILSYIIIDVSQYKLIPAYVIAAGSLLFVFQNKMERILLIIFVFIEVCFMIDNIHKGKRKIDAPPLYYIGIPIVISFFLQGRQNFVFLSILFYLGIAYIFFNLLNKYLQNFVQFYNLNETNSALPAHQMQFHSHLRIIILFSIGFFILLLFSGLSFNKVFFNITGSFFTGVFFLLSKLPFFHLDSGEPQPERNMPLSVGSYSDSWIWLIICITFFSFIMFLCISFIYNYVRLKKRVKVEFDEKIEFLSPFSIKKESRKKRIKHRKKSLLFSTDINSKIRRLFYRKIKADTPKTLTISKNLTPSELYSLTGRHATEEGNTFVSIYEKARYSGLTCTKDDLKNMKEIKSKE